MEESIPKRALACTLDHSCSELQDVETHTLTFHSDVDVHCQSAARVPALRGKMSAPRALSRAFAAAAARPNQPQLKVFLGADGPPASTAEKRSGASRTAAACVLFALAGAAFPFWYSRTAEPTDMSKALSNQQISRRGPYINSGSSDAGPGACVCAAPVQRGSVQATPAQRAVRPRSEAH